MAKNKNDLMSLSSIFKNYELFRIPNYQRGYSWEEEQRKALWEDLENMTENRYHYTGMFTFCQVDDEYDIVDGQQRMTTLIILINELLKRITGPIDDYTKVEECRDRYLFKPSNSGISNRYKFGYREDDASDVYFITKILEQPDSRNHQISEDSFYTKNLRDAKFFFQNKIKNYTQEQLISLFKKVTERLKFNVYLIDDPTEVYVTFETMNNRGKNLSTLELLKNRLMYLITLHEDKEEQKKDVQTLQNDINNTWRNIYNFLGKDQKKLNDDTFLRDHWIMYFGYDKEKGFKNDLLSIRFTTKKFLTGECNIKCINDYVKNLNDSIIHWYNINCPNSSNLSVEEKILLTRLNHLSLGSFKPLLMAVYEKNKETNDIKELLEACERFRFLIFAVSNRRSHTEESNFYGLAHKFFRDTSNTYSVSGLTKDINDKTELWLNIPSFINSAVEWYYKDTKDGFYSWSGLRYFLYEYERSLQEETRDKNVKTTWESFEHNQAGKRSIEHIYPQTPTDPYWMSRFTTEQDKKLVHSLGNLLLLSIGKNAEQQNYSFDVKKVTKRNDKGEVEHNGYDEGSYSEIEVSKLNEWTPNAIIKRGKKLIAFLVDHWKINYTFTEDDINKLLNVS